MPRYIDADMFEVVSLTDKSEEYTNGALHILDMVDKALTADVQEIKHGKWMRTFPNEPLDGNYFCSNCQSGIDIATAEETPTDRELFYCPNCGAKMDGEESGG